MRLFQSNKSRRVDIHTWAGTRPAPTGALLKWGWLGMTYRGMLCIALMLYLTGCEDAVSPSLGIDRPFTLWGNLNPKVDLQAVRVFEIEETIQVIQAEPLDAEITTTDLETGEVVAWKDSVVSIRDRGIRHVYWADFDVVHNRRYRMTAKRSDGALSTAEVTVPPAVELEVLPPDSNAVSEILLPLFIRGDPPSLVRIEVWYNAIAINSTGTQTIQRPVTLPFTGVPRKGPAGYTLFIDLREDLARIRSFYSVNQVQAETIELRSMELRVHVGNAEWASPIGEFDPEFLVEPGVLSNVENGFGFVGAGYVEIVNWRPPSVLLQRAGFDS